MKLTKGKRALTVLAAGVLAAGCLGLVAGCSSNDTQADSQSASEARTSDTNEDETTTSVGETMTAMVVAQLGDDHILFVDQSNDTPFVAYVTSNLAYDEDGEAISAEDLEVGDIVEVTGDGIMLQSYPSQYPGITKITITKEGDKADAEKYATIVDQIVSAGEADQVPGGYVEYTNSGSTVSVILNPYEYELVVAGNNNSNSTLKKDGEWHDANGLLTENTNDAVVAESTTATIGFTSTPLNIDIERTPIAKQEDSSVIVNLASEDEDVPTTAGDANTFTFTMEPGYVYTIEADFAQGEASYVFYTTK
jgi:hypothetical protein